MSYVNILEYNIIPTDTFKIKRGCGGCGCKQLFSCKNNFRVNANGNLLDVWLIYGCEKCGHTYNLSIYERINPYKIPEEEYSRYLANDMKMVFKMGTDKTVFSKNKAEIARKEIEYRVEPVGDGMDCKEVIDEDLGGIFIRINNPYEVPIREDKLVAEILNVTRSKAKKLLSEERVVFMHL